MKKIRLRKGTILYHGTSAPDDFTMPNGPAWFSDSEAVARKFVDWHTYEGAHGELGRPHRGEANLARPRILKFRVETPPKLALINDTRELEELMEETGIQELNYEELFPMSAYGYDGWTIPDNYGPGEADIMLLRPDEFLEFVEEYEVKASNPGLKPKLDELNRLAQTLTYYHWLKEHGLSWSEIVGIRRETDGGIGFKLRDGRAVKFKHIPFGDEVVFNRPIYTPAENPDDPEAWKEPFLISEDGGKTWIRIPPGQGFYLSAKDRKALREGKIVDDGRGWLIKRIDVEPKPSSNPPATPTVLSRDYYHATPDAKFGEPILKDGLIIPRPGKAGKSFQAPRKDFVYMSPQLYYAAIYALGGVFMGHDYPEDHWRGMGRYGYIFLVHKGDLIDAEPDEDDVGEMATADMDKRGPDWLKAMAEWDARPTLARDLKWAKQEKLRRAKDGEMAYQSLIGKQLLKRLDDDRKEFLMNMAGVNIANRGPVGFDAAWRLDKSRAPEIAEDGSNVLEIAERIK